MNLKFFEATSSRTVGILLRVLADEGIHDTNVWTDLDQKRHIVFYVSAEMDDAFYERMKKRYLYMKS